MDIQVVDPASMPREDRPSGPRKKLIAAIGFKIKRIPPELQEPEDQPVTELEETSGTVK